MEYHFEIQEISKETFFKQQRVGGALKSTGRGKTFVRIDVLVKGFGWTTIRQPTRAKSEYVAQHLLCISKAEWTRMLATYEVRAQREKARREKRERQQEIAFLRRDVRRGQAASRQLKKLEA